VADFLAEKNICVRSGHHCTEPLHQALGLSGTVRMSIGIYTTQQDVEVFFSVLDEAFYHI
jgi:cysteine sulfinate desulfinase